MKNNPFVSELSRQWRRAVVGLKFVTTTFTSFRSILLNHHQPYKRPINNWDCDSTTVRFLLRCKITWN